MPQKPTLPYKVTAVSADEDKIINKCLYGYIPFGSFVRCGPEGYVMPARFKKCASRIYNMEVRPDDIWVITFPRSGTTWTQEMIWLLENNMDFETAKSKPLYDRFPMLETTAQIPEIGMFLIKANFMNLGSFQGLDKACKTPSWESIENAPSPRYIKTHLPLSMLPPNLLNTAKVVYVARDPRDVAVSYYYLQKLVAKSLMKITFMEFWEAFRKDLLPWTPAIAHANEAWKQINHPNLHFIFYEELKADLLKEVYRMSKFLGHEYSDCVMDQLCQHLGFKSFRNNHKINNNIDTDDKVQFVRKGEAGGWVKYFDDKMVVQADEYMTTRLQKFDIRYPSYPLHNTECSRL